jgi:hypothetical protein
MDTHAATGPATLGTGRSDLGLRHLPETVRRLVLEPSAFFATLPHHGAIAGAFAFGLASMVVATAAGGLLTLAGMERVQGAAAVLLYLGSLSAGQDLAGTELTGAGLLAAVALAPLYGTLLLLAMAVTAHLLVIVVVGEGNAGFGASFRAIAYASVVNLVNWLPVVGLPLNLYGAYLATLGLRAQHGTTTWRAAIVAFAPLAAVIAFFLLLRLAPE